MINYSPNSVGFGLPTVTVDREILQSVVISSTPVVRLLALLAEYELKTVWHSVCSNKQEIYALNLKV